MLNSGAQPRTNVALALMGNKQAFQRYKSSYQDASLQ